ncbi:mechanosensitive ion channel domain-containing protein [Tenacibaculum maritimum]|uniref:mechanosensitive ion channel domain-containing protein n=1 Tax=Tenacibaculum maritimum TaxID=107401 RepID=UPI0012E678C1|nr:mechanosensitive ion channel domain-containing protein [Tenacibaculum maritimum]MCD9564200.1 mechanosensitive ion channel family protein [Tenacibaculum maritimum]MCD9565552.1 mechanosensitive ion channel family protein [Tenacibaculum maritimum]MCD9579175.1 mechanosensitive ion channel family protein [Tenacibaculum maritimum]MCD9596101.1 mechanosensitive ion channel family protein [Tenacibaculum maritimum]MCD9613350.1 mechanosensitive ion channel family protein [Tenacibaculum maritimum]
MGKFIILTIQTPLAQFIISVLILGFLIQVTKKLTKKYITEYSIEPHRRKLILNILYLIYYLVFGVFLLIIFGVNFKEVLIFASSILAVLGVGFFAQWSILSNLTASVILFFYHPMRIGDNIRIVDKEYDFVGVVKNITGIYVQLYVEDGNREITIPNTVILYKAIEIIKKN